MSVASVLMTSVNKPDANGRGGYETLTHCRLYCGIREKKVGHELTRDYFDATASN